MCNLHCEIIMISYFKDIHMFSRVFPETLKQHLFRYIFVFTVLLWNFNAQVEEKRVNCTVNIIMPVIIHHNDPFLRSLVICNNRWFHFEPNFVIIKVTRVCVCVCVCVRFDLFNSGTIGLRRRKIVNMPIHWIHTSERRFRLIIKLLCIITLWL